jgi:hypothetical protein
LGGGGDVGVVDGDEGGGGVGEDGSEEGGEEGGLERGGEGIEGVDYEEVFLRG